MPERDTGLLVNTSKGTVHRPACDVVMRTNQRSGRWLAPWRGVAITDTDKPCGYCLPDGLPTCTCGHTQHTHNAGRCFEVHRDHQAADEHEPSPEYAPRCPCPRYEPVVST